MILDGGTLESLVKKPSSRAPQMAALTCACHRAWLSFVNFSITSWARRGFVEVDDDDDDAMSW
jgi:hypothetical protein